MEFARDIGKHSINILLSISYWGLGFNICVGDFSVIISINLLILHLTFFINRGRRLDG